MADRTTDLDLWGAITVTGQGHRIEGSIAELDRLCLILGGWMKP